MLHLMFYIPILLQFLSSCYAICCNNHNALCLVNSETCTPNCDDGVSLCDCPGACLNDNFGGCNSDYQCIATVISIIYSGYPTATTTVYVTTYTSYYVSTQTFDVILQSTNFIASTVYETITSTVYTTVPGPQATVSRRALVDDRRVLEQDVAAGKIGITVMTIPHVTRGNPRLAKRETTVTSISYDPGNYCGQSTFDNSFPGCTTTITEGVVDTELSTAWTQATFVQTADSVVFTTVQSYYYITSTVTAPGNTVTVVAPTAITPNSDVPSAASEPDVTVTNVNTATATDMVTATPTSLGANSDGDVVVTHSNTAIATVTASSSHGDRAISGFSWRKLLEICSLVAWQLFFHII